MSILIEVHSDTDIPVTGYLVMDSFVSGAAHGGLRIAPDVTADRLSEAARTMTLKYGWAGLPVGGAKAGLLISPETSELDRALMLRAFGRAIRPYLRTRMYVPGEDMGSTAADIVAVLATAGLRPLPDSLMYTASGLFTGVGVCAAGIAAAMSVNLPVDELRVTIEGLGNVGASAARRFHEAGARVTAVSTVQGALYNERGLDIPGLLAERKRHGDAVVLRPGFGDFVPPASLIGVPTDVFCPCATMHSITIDNVRSLQARVVCPGANVPATEEAEAVLNERQVLFVPDFVANCGGVLGSSMSRAGLGQDEVASIVQRRLHKQTSLLIVDAGEQRRTLHEVATAIALERFNGAKARYEMKTPAQSMMRLAVEVYRRGLIPRPLRAPLGRWYYGARKSEQPAT